LLLKEYAPHIESAGFSSEGDRELLAINITVKHIIFYSLLILALAAAGVGSASAILFRGAEIYPAVFIGDIDVGRLTKQAAIARVNEYFEARKGTPLVILSIEGQEWPLYATEIDAQYDVPEMVEQAFHVAREGYSFQRIRERYLVMQQRKTIPLKAQYSQWKLDAFVQRFTQHYTQMAVDASIQYHNGHLSINEHKPGRELSAERVLVSLNDAMQNEWGRKVPLSVDVTVPHILTSDIASISKEWTSYTTEFNSGDFNRTVNIILAAQAINGTILKPDDIFSFNKIVGLRAREKGYRDAPAYIHGKLVMDAGGGVCQVTSTLYNSVLLANLEIIERSSHFRPPGYVPLGQDATVADNFLDFRFKNNSASTLYIQSEVLENRLVVRIFGADVKQLPNIQILTMDHEVLEANTIIKQDPELPLGQKLIEQEYQKGYRVTTVRVVSYNGKETKREILSQDEFSPVDKIIKVGTKVTGTPTITSVK
jgi:vancomycin resistance protein YoaR